jgi:hypothetical protein
VVAAGALLGKEIPEAGKTRNHRGRMRGRGGAAQAIFRCAGDRMVISTARRPKAKMQSHSVGVAAVVCAVTTWSPAIIFTRMPADKWKRSLCSAQRVLVVRGGSKRNGW